MAEGFEPYGHVPQQSRRDKLRVAAAGDKSAVVKEEGGCRSLIPAASSGPPLHHHHQQQQFYAVDPPAAVPVNPSCSTTIHDMGTGGAFLYAPQTLQNLRDLAHSYSNSTLSLSLSSHDNAADNNHLATDNLGLPLELNLQRYGSTAATAGGCIVPTSVPIGEVSRSSVPLGPFTGYSLILKGSRFLRPSQQLLEELCDVGRTGLVEKIPEADSSLVIDPASIESYMSIEESSSSPNSSRGDGGEIRRKKSRLISMLEEVCRRYKQYYQQMQDVVASFEYVAGFGNAAPYANLALKAMSKHFKSLKSAITDQLQLSKEHGNPRRDEGYSRLGSNDGNPYGQRPISNAGFFDHHQPAWRPQRGLPDRAVTVLRAWLFEHFLHPYPTDTDKIMLAKQTGLSRSQVSNWFINARVRLWKPMVEEIHTLETQQAQKASTSQREDKNVNSNSSRPVDHQLPMATEAMSTSSQRVHESISNKRTRNDGPIVPLRSDSSRPQHLSFDPLTHPHHISVGEGIRSLNNSVSLTLGLHQNNNGIGLPEAFQVNAVQRFELGIEGSSDGFVLSGYEGQDRQFGRDVYGGQLLHDFVG